MKENNLLSLRPDIAKEWNYEKNVDLKPNDVVPGASKKVWWKCEKGHEWEARINDRTRTPEGKQINGTGCPYCNNRKVCDDNNLEALNPKLAKEWNYEKNGDLKPSDVVPGSSKKVWWKCEKGHEWEAKIVDRNKGKGCPYCSNQKVCDENSLEKLNRLLAKEWNYEKNGDLKPSDVVPGSSKKVWWKCEKGHEWEAQIRYRNKNMKCPICNDNKISFEQMAIYYYLSKVFDDIKNRYIYIENKVRCEIDVFIPILSLGVEYDGEYWHQNSYENDLKKNEKLKDKIDLIRIREKGLKKINEEKDYVRADSKYISLEDSIKYIFDYILDKYTLQHNIKLKIRDIDIHIERDKFDILSMLKKEIEENSIEVKYPEIAREFHEQRNGNLKPKDISSYSKLKVWWKCEKGHEWEASVEKRCGNTSKQTGCPYCANQKVDDTNSLATIRPDLEKIWNYDKNINIDIVNITTGSNKKVWWKCEKGHEWQATVANRVRKINSKGCPYCSGQKVCEDNNLETIAPNLAKEWNFDKNINIRPSDVVTGSNKKVWWKCEKGHEWEARVTDRYNKHRGCPYCSGQKVCKDNSLETLRPDIAKEWNSEKNGELKASDVTVGSGKKVWWRCENGHEWQATIVDRTRGRRCQQCKNKYFSK